MSIIIADIVISTIAIIWLIAASITDIKKREVPDWLSFSLITLGLATRLIASLLFSNFSYFFYSLIGLGIFIAIGFSFYYAKVFGGGDAKLLIALGACFGSRPFFAKTPTSFYPEPFLLTFMVNLLFLGAIYGIFFSAILALKKKKEFCLAYKKIDKNYKIFYFVFAFLIFVFAIITKLYNLISLSVILAFLPYIFSLVKASEKLMIKQKSWHELAEGDWLVKEIKIKNKIIKPTVHGLTKKDIQEIKKANKKVLVQDGIPFVPVFLVALLVSMFLGNLLLLILT